MRRSWSNNLRAGPLIIIPGVMSDAEAWGTVASLMGTDREVHVINRRGRQPSSNLPDDYSFLTEVEDLKAVFENVAQPAHVFGWSLGGLIAIHAVATGADALSLALYEPVMSPFGREQLGALRAARTWDDFDTMVEIVNRDISGYSQGHVDALRQNRKSWTRLCLLALLLADEIQALSAFVPTWKSTSQFRRV